MALLVGKSSPQPSRPPVSRYKYTNPLRRDGGLRLLTYALPEPLRSLVMDTLRRPPLFDGKVVSFAVQNLYRARPSSAALASMSQHGKATFVRIEVEVARRIVEAPQDSIDRGLRNALLMAQSLELGRLYLALLAQCGEMSALAIFQQALEDVW
jgi:hypothetical protein